MIQLPKLPAEPRNESLERWCEFLRDGQNLDPEALPSHLNTEPIRQAVQILSTMAFTPRDRQIYEARRRHHMDQVSSLNLALREGIDKGKAEGERAAIRVVFESRFGPMTAELASFLESISETARLETLLKQVARAVSIDELRTLWNAPTAA